MISLPLNNPVAFILSSCFRFLKKRVNNSGVLSSFLYCIYSFKCNEISHPYCPKICHLEKANNVFGVLVLLFSFEWKTGL